MLLFIDESGHHESGTPYEVLAGVAVSEDNLWNLVKAVRSAERDHFGGYLRNLLSDETKGRKLLKTKRFKLANRNIEINAAELPTLANSLLLKGKAASRAKPPVNRVWQIVVGRCRKWWHTVGRS